MEKHKTKNIPEYLIDSDLIRNIDLDERYFYVPEGLYKKDTVVNNMSDFINLFETCRYWGAKFPMSFFDFSLENKREVLKFLYSKSDEGNIFEIIDELSNSEIIEYKILGTDRKHMLLIIKLGEGKILEFGFKCVRNRIVFYRDLFEKNTIFEVFKKIAEDENFSNLTIGFKNNNSLVFSNKIYLDRISKSYLIIYNINKFTKKHQINLFKRLTEELENISKGKILNKYLFDKHNFVEMCLDFIGHKTSLSKFYTDLIEFPSDSETESD